MQQVVTNQPTVIPLTLFATGSSVQTSPAHWWAYTGANQSGTLLSGPNIFPGSAAGSWSGLATLTGSDLINPILNALPALSPSGSGYLTVWISTQETSSFIGQTIHTYQAEIQIYTPPAAPSITATPLVLNGSPEIQLTGS